MEWTGAAAKIGGIDRQTLRDWVHRFNASGPEGLINNSTEGPKPRLSEEQLAQFVKIVEAGPDREKDGIVRWRRIDLKRVSMIRAGAGDWTTTSSQPRQAYLGRRTTSTRNCAGTTSSSRSRSHRSGATLPCSSGR